MLRNDIQGVSKKVSIKILILMNSLLKFSGIFLILFLSIHHICKFCLVSHSNSLLLIYLFKILETIYKQSDTTGVDNEGKKLKIQINVLKMHKSVETT